MGSVDGNHVDTRYVLRDYRSCLADYETPWAGDRMGWRLGRRLLYNDDFLGGLRVYLRENYANKRVLVQRYVKRCYGGGIEWSVGEKYYCVRYPI